MRDLNFISIDMEYNQPSESIIQIGIAVGNLKSGEILDEYECYIYQDEQISEYITNLTGITQSNVDGGISLSEAYEVITEMHTEYECFRNPITWGGGDSVDLRDALDLDDKMFVFGQRWIDCKTLFVSWCFANNLKHQSGLAKSMTRLGLSFQGKKHTALDDAKNTFVVYRHLLEKVGE